MLLKNVEIKAKIHDFQKTHAQVTKLCPQPVSIEKQTDTFFITSKGRLKLRETTEKSALIYYDRIDSIEPSKSDIAISFIDDPNTLKLVLVKSLGIRGVVEKERSLYKYDQTRIHLDDVKGLGKYIELEVVLKKDQTVDDGKMIAKELMNTLNINESDLISVAYIDLIEGKKK